MIHYSGEPGNKSSASVCKYFTSEFQIKYKFQVREDRFEEIAEDSLIRINNGEDAFNDPNLPEEIIRRARSRVENDLYLLFASP